MGNSIGIYIGLAIGTALILGTLVAAIRRRAWMRSATKLVAVAVSEVRETRGRGRGCYYYPILRVRDHSDTEHIIEYRSGRRNRSSFRTGDRVVVFFDPVNPQLTEIASFHYLWKGYIFTLIMGLAFFLAGLAA